MESHVIGVVGSIDVVGKGACFEGEAPTSYGLAILVGGRECDQSQNRKDLHLQQSVRGNKKKNDCNKQTLQKNHQRINFLNY